MTGVGDLIGRRDATDAADRAIGALKRGRGSALLAVGEPGIGKTRVLAELALRARRAELPVLVGRAVEFEDDVPLGVLADALDDAMAAHRAALARALGPQRLALLAPAFPAFDGDGEAAHSLPAGGVARSRVHAASRALIEHLAGSRGLVLALDDLQWADPASIDLLAHLLRRPPRRTLLALAARTPGLPVALQHAIDRAAVDRGGAVVVLELGPLGPADSARLLGNRADPAQARRWHRETGGNPFYLESLARTGRGRIDAATATELAALPASAVAVAHAAAVIGDPCDAGLAAAAVDRPLGEVLDALDVLLGADVLRTTGQPQQLRFRHPILRRAVYDAIPTATRLQTHARVVRALRARDAPVTALARHVAACATPGDVEAATLLAQAGLAMADVAPSSAARWFEAALRVLPRDDASAMRRLALTARRAMCLGASGELAESREALRDIIARLPRDGSRQRGEAVAFAGAIDALLGRRPEGLALVEQEIADLPRPDAPGAAIVHVQHAALCVYAARFADARRSALTARALAHAHRQAGLAATAGALAAMGAYCVGDVDAARHLATVVADEVNALPDDELAQRTDALGWLGWTEFFLERYAAAERHLVRGTRIANGGGQEHALIGLLAGHSAIVLTTGRLGDHPAIAEAAFETAAVTGTPQAEAWALAGATWAHLLSGHLVGALESSARAVALLGPDHDAVSVLVHGMRAEALLEAEQPDEAIAVLLVGAGGPDLPLIESPYHPRWRELLTRAELAAGRPERAAREARAAVDAAAGTGLRLRAAEAQRALAAVALHDGDAQAAALAARAAAAHAAAAAAPIDEGRARILAGRAHALAGRRDDALRELTAARVVLHGRGAQRAADEAARELRRLGHRVSAAGRGPGPAPHRTANGAAGAPAGPGLDVLSPREREIADLVSHGHTNAQIAAQLHLSRRTVETHVRHVFDKLGVSSRAAVARVVTEQR